jgi:uncharacterized membrane protein YtjA (UPF0391 family)
MLTSWLADARHAVRRLRAQWIYAVLAVVTLALGVGGTAASYAAVRSVLFDAGVTSVHVVCALVLECARASVE